TTYGISSLTSRVIPDSGALAVRTNGGARGPATAGGKGPPGRVRSSPSPRIAAMVTTAIKLAIASIAFATFVESANAQGMPPQCAVRRDPVRCLCALQNGGTFTQSPGSRGRTLII